MIFPKTLEPLRIFREYGKQTTKLIIYKIAIYYLIILGVGAIAFPKRGKFGVFSKKEVNLWYFLKKFPFKQK